MQNVLQKWNVQLSISLESDKVFLLLFHMLTIQRICLAFHNSTLPVERCMVGNFLR